MIGHLPTKLNVNGTDRAIRTDFRTALLIFQAYNDPELIEDDVAHEKTEAMLECLYEDLSDIAREDITSAVEQAIWFLDGGSTQNNESKYKKSKKVMDWEQDEQIIFSAVNKVAGKETRAVDYMHWWTFLGYFNEIGEGLFTTVINIRQKKNKRKKLEKHEEEFYKENRHLVDIKVRYTPEEQAEIDRLNTLLQ